MLHHVWESWLYKTFINLSGWCYTQHCKNVLPCQDISKFLWMISLNIVKMSQFDKTFINILSVNDSFRSTLWTCLNLTRYWWTYFPWRISLNIVKIYCLDKTFLSMKDIAQHWENFSAWQDIHKHTFLERFHSTLWKCVNLTRHK